MPFGCFAMCLR